MPKELNESDLFSAEQIENMQWLVMRENSIRSDMALEQLQNLQAHHTQLELECLEQRSHKEHLLRAGSILLNVSVFVTTSAALGLLPGGILTTAFAGGSYLKAKIEPFDPGKMHRERAKIVGIYISQLETKIKEEDQD